MLLNICIVFIHLYFYNSMVFFLLKYFLFSFYFHFLHVAAKLTLRQAKCQRSIVTLNRKEVSKIS